MLQAAAMTVGIALLLWSTGLPTFFRLAEAASITSASDTISDSRPSTASNHTIEFTTPNGMSIGQTFKLTFDAAFTMTSIIEDDVDILVNGSSSSTAATAGANTWGVARLGNTITFTTPTNQGVASSSVITVKIGNHTVTSGTGVNQITNPAATSSYPIDIGKGTSTAQDSGQVRVAIVDEVLVSASVDTSLTFTVGGFASNQTINGSTATTATSTSATAIPFGTLPIGSEVLLGQSLEVTTNASNGYVVTVHTTGPFMSTTGADIDAFVNGSDTNTPTAWSGPSALISDENSYGHWGLTSTDHATTSRATEFSINQWIAPSTTPRIIMGHDGPADGLTGGIGTSTIGYQVEISALQEAGDDYETSLIYVATPTF